MKKNYKKLFLNISNGIKIGVLALVIFSFVFVSFSTAYTSFTSFYQKKGVPWIDSMLSSVYGIKVYDLFLTYTGLDTGYGFFSPNVKSDIVIINTLYKDGKVEKKLPNDYLTTREGKIRFRGASDLFMDKLSIEEKKLEKKTGKETIYEKKEDSLKLQFFKIVLKQMNKHYLYNNAKNYDSVNTKVYLYHYPTLKEYPDLKPKLIKIESITLTK